jgi:hypothetical protein
MPVYAYDKDNGNADIDLEDVVDASVIEPKEDEVPTGIETIGVENSTIKGHKVILNGQLYLIQGEKIYNALGAEIK